MAETYEKAYAEIERLQDILFRAEPYTTHYATDNVARLVREAAKENDNG